MQRTLKVGSDALDIALSEQRRLKKGKVQTLTKTQLNFSPIKTKTRKSRDFRRSSPSHRISPSHHGSNKTDLSSAKSRMQNKKSNVPSNNTSPKPVRLIVTAPRKLFTNMKRLCKSYKTDMLKFLIRGGVDVDTCDHTGNTLLMHMVTSGNRHMTRVLLDLKADPNAVDTWGNTALHSAYQHKHSELIKILKKFGADETHRNKKGVTPLEVAQTLERNAHASKHMWQAVEHYDELMVEELVRQGGTVDLRNDKGLTPLMVVVRKRNVKMVKCLLDQQADPNLQEPQELMTVMHYALLRDSHDKLTAEIVRLLHSAKANLSIRNRRGYTAMDWSRKVRKEASGTMPHSFRQVCIDGDLPAVRHFLHDGFEGDVINARDDFGKTALILAAERGHTEVCRMILKAKADPDMQEATTQHNTALHYAYISNNQDLKDILIEDYHADTHIHNALGFNCVLAERHAAAARHQISLNRRKNRAEVHIQSLHEKRNRQPFCQALLDHVLLGEIAEVDKKLASSTKINPVYINGQNSYGNTVLMEAASECMFRMVNHLLTKCKADPNIQNNRYETALHIAYEEDSIAIVNALLYNGADATVRNSIGFIPREIPLRQRGNELERERLEREKEARIAAIPRYAFIPLVEAVEARDLKLIEELISKHGADVNARMKRTGDTVLIHAAKKDAVEVCELLVSLRADVNIANRSGNTALHIAFADFNEPLKLTLLKANANLAARNNFGDTPYSLQKLLTHLPGGRPATSYSDLSATWPKPPKVDNEVEELAAKMRMRLSPLLVGFVEVGDVQRIQDFFDKEDDKVDVDARNQHGETALMLAVMHNQVEVVRYLVEEEGAEINAQNRRGNSALHLGYIHGDHPRMMQTLLELKADPSICNNLGASPMQLYNQFKRQKSQKSNNDKEFRDFMEKRNFVGQFATLLLQKTIDVKDTSGNEMSIRSNSSIDDAESKSAPDTAVQDAMLKLIKERYKQAPGDTSEAKRPFMQDTFNFPTATGDTLLALAISKRNERIARALLPHSNPNTTNSRGRTALHAAYEVENYDMVELLEDSGADKTLRDKMGMSPFDIGINSYNRRIKSYMSQVKAIQARDVDVMSEYPGLLAMKARLGHAAGISGLVKTGVSLNIVQKDTGMTPLLEAAAHGHVDAVRVMVELKANPTTMNKKRQSGLQLASLNGHEDVVEFLQTLEPVLQVVELQGLANQARMIRDEKLQEHKEMLEFELAMAKKEQEMAVAGREEESSPVLQFNDEQELVPMTNADNELQSLVNFESGERPGSAMDQQQMSFGLRSGW